MKKGIRYSGHTMGTPGRDMDQVIALFGGLGYDGIEVRVAADGQIDSESITDGEVRALAQRTRAAGLAYSCLTPYYKDFVTQARDDTMAKMRRVVEIASMLDCPLVRVYGGPEPNTIPGVWFNDVWSRTVTGLQELARYAAPLGVGLTIETHIGSLTMSARDAVHLVEDVNMSNVGVLFDYAWVELAGAETGAAAVRTVARCVNHVHIKDWALESRIPLKKTSTLMGEGTVGWPEVLRELRNIGYQGWVSDEYEKFWYPADLPEPEVGMKHNLNYVKSYLEA